MSTRPAAIALAALLLAQPLGAAPVRTNPFNERLRVLDDWSRRAALSRAIVDSGGRCGRVTLVHDDGAYGNLGRWSVRCDPGGDHAVYMGPDGSVQMRHCDEVRGLKLPACTLPPVGPARPTRR